MSRELVIGASSAGLYTAIRLAQKGLPVNVIEKREDPRPIERMLIVTPEVLRFVDLPDDLVLNRIRKFELNSRNEQAVINLAEPDIVFDRKDFLLYLEQKAKDAGVEIIKARSFKGIFKDGKDWYAECNVNGSDRRKYYNFKRIIGADGADSIIARCFDKKLSNVYLIQARVALGNGFKEDTVKIWFDKDYTDYFIWLIPDGNGEAVCGLIHDDHNRYKKSLNLFLKNHDLTPITYECGSTPCYSPNFVPECSLDGATAYLVGDAGCQVKMTTVGGTFAGLWGGYLLADAIAQNIPFNQSYAKLKRELNIHYLMRRFLKVMNNDEYDLLVCEAGRHLKPLLYKLPRDQARKIHSKIFFDNPFLVIAGFKSAFRYKFTRYLKQLTKDIGFGDLVSLF